MFLDNEGSIDTSYDEWLAVFRTIVESVIPHKNVVIRPYDVHELWPDEWICSAAGHAY